MVPGGNMRIHLMCKSALALLSLSLLAWSQNLPIAPPAEAVVAVVNGRRITKSDYQRMLEAQDPNMRALAQKQPKAFLEQFAMYETVLAAAEKAGLDQQSPFKERIAMSRRQILVTGLIDERHKAFNASPAEIEQHYQKTKDNYRQAIVRVIFISGVMETRNLDTKQVTKAATPEEIQAKAEAAARRAREGEDFAAIARELSDDPASGRKGGEFPHPIRPNSTNVPPNMRDAILAAKAGEVVGPIKHTTGFYVFKIESNGQATLEQVREDIVKELKDTRLKQWLDEFKKSSSATVEDETLLSEAAKAK